MKLTPSRRNKGTIFVAQISAVVELNFKKCNKNKVNVNKIKMNACFLCCIPDKFQYLRIRKPAFYNEMKFHTLYAV